MRGLDEQMLATMRSIVTDYFPDLVSIYSVTVSGHTRYGTAIVSSGLVTSVLGQLYNPTGREQNLISSLARAGVLAEETMMLNLPYGTPITQQYKVVTDGGLDWDVVHTTVPMTFNAATQCVITRRRVNSLPEVNQNG